MNNKTDPILQKLVQATPFLVAITQYKSFSKAADYLGVHQSAISHRIKLLEDTLGFALFQRTTRHVDPTALGDIICQGAVRAFTNWEEALEQIQNYKTSQTIRLSLSSSLAMKWVLPAMPRAYEKGLSISIDVNDHPSDFTTKAVDAAIRFGPGPYPGLHSTHLSKAELLPVASPAYKVPDNFRDGIFLADSTGLNDDTDFNWDYYFSQTTPDDTPITPHTYFSRADLMLQATISSMGIGLGRTFLIENDLASGFLKPIGPRIPLKSAYWLVCSPDFATTQRYQTLLNWLKDLVQETSGKEQI